MNIRKITRRLARGEFAAEQLMIGARQDYDGSHLPHIPVHHLRALYILGRAGGGIDF